jgi:hypothetical protein
MIRMNAASIATVSGTIRLREKFRRIERSAKRKLKPGTLAKVIARPLSDLGAMIAFAFRRLGFLSATNEATRVITKTHDTPAQSLANVPTQL